MPLDNPAWFYWRENALFLHIYLQPRASENKIIGPHADCLKIKLTAPPLDNRANNLLIKFLAKELETRQKNIVIISGQTNRKKWLRIEQPKQLDILNENYFSK